MKDLQQDDGRPGTIDWQEVYRENLPRVYNYLRFRVGDDLIAEDLTSTTFEKAWKNRYRYKREIGAFSNWLLSIASNLAIDYFRKKRAEVSLVHLDTHGSAQSTEEVSDRNAQYARLLSLLGELSLRDRELFALKYGADLTNRQIAKEPSPEFADALYQKIAVQQSFLSKLRTTLNKPVSTARVGLILIGSVLIVGTCARQVFTPRQVQVGDFWVHEMSEKFICAGDTVYPSYTPSSPLPTPQPAPTNPPTISLQELKERLDFPLRIPTWAPEGFTLRKRNIPYQARLYAIQLVGVVRTERA